MFTEDSTFAFTFAVVGAELVTTVLFILPSSAMMWVKAASNVMFSFISLLKPNASHVRSLSGVVVLRSVSLVGVGST